jgi:hypothetical protein
LKRLSKLGSSTTNDLHGCHHKGGLWTHHLDPVAYLKVEGRYRLVPVPANYPDVGPSAKVFAGIKANAVNSIALISIV